MNLTIGGKEYTMYFGLDFLDYLDRVYSLDVGKGIKVGNGVMMAVVNIEAKNPVVLLHLIKAATITEKSQPSTADIKKYLETEADYEALFSDFLSSLETAYVTRSMMKGLSNLPAPKKTKKTPG